jgi:hypothetical protein
VEGPAVEGRDPAARLLHDRHPGREILWLVEELNQPVEPALGDEGQRAGR